MDKVNIQRLANELNLSIATVSRALRDSHQIRPETRQKVWDLARRLNYQPNPFASGLRGQKSKNIAVIFPELANNFFSHAINGIEEIARQKDYQVLIYLTHESAQREIDFVTSLGNGRVDGLLLSFSSETTNYNHIAGLSSKLPVVLFDRVSDDIELRTIATDDYESSFKATQHLLEQGCKRIMFLMALKNLLVGQQRLKGYTDALLQAGAGINENLIIDCDRDGNQNMQKIREAMLQHKPDGTLSSIENLGIACYQAARELQVAIPQQLKVVSFSNLETASLLNPSLTTITQPAFEIGKEAANTLFALLEKKRPPAENKIIPSVLIKRESTAIF
jgi:LacI family transcriptional regulator